MPTKDKAEESKKESQLSTELLKKQKEEGNSLKFSQKS